MYHQRPRMMRERRQTSLSATTPVSTPSASAVVDSDTTSAVNLSFPTTTKALAVVVAVLCTIILLGVGICMFRRWKKRNAKTSTVDFTSDKLRRYDVDSKLDLHASAYGLEKPSPAFMFGGDMNPNWVPQIPPNRGADLVSTTTSKSKKSKRSTKKSLRVWSRALSNDSQWSPPPSYIASDPASGEKPAIVVSQVPLPPSPPHQATLPPTPPTPVKRKKIPFLREEIPPAKPAPPTGLPPLPLPSPARSASFAVHQSASFSPTEHDVQQMPRLMDVINTFAPSLDDELPIQIGEIVHVLAEYQDGWALVQRAGLQHDAPSGVVPRSCLAERERIIPNTLRL